MKIVVTIYGDDEDTSYRKYCVKPQTDEELHEAAQDVVSFISECFEFIEEEGY